MTHSQACHQLAKFIQTTNAYAGGLAIAVFIEETDNGETPAMALALAKEAATNPTGA